MKVTELIERLDFILQADGDLEVVMLIHDYESDEIVLEAPNTIAACPSFDEFGQRIGKVCAFMTAEIDQLVDYEVQ